MSECLYHCRLLPSCNAMTDGFHCVCCRNSPEFQKLLGIAMELFLLCSDDSESDVRMVADECLNKVVKVSLSIDFYTASTLCPLAMSAAFIFPVCYSILLQFLEVACFDWKNASLIRNPCSFITMSLLWFCRHFPLAKRIKNCLIPWPIGTPVILMQ